MRNHRTSGGAFYRLPITHRTNPAIAGTVIHPHGYHVPPCRLKADIRGSDQSAVHVLPRTLSNIQRMAWLWCMSTVAYRKTRLILWQCSVLGSGGLLHLFADFLIDFNFFLSINLFTSSWYVISFPCEVSANVMSGQTRVHIADSFFFVCYLLLILPHISQKHIKKISIHWKRKKGIRMISPFFVLLCRVFKPW